MDSKMNEVIYVKILGISNKIFFVKLNDLQHIKKIKSKIEPF